MACSCLPLFPAAPAAGEEPVPHKKRGNRPAWSAPFLPKAVCWVCRLPLNAPLHPACAFVHPADQPRPEVNGSGGLLLRFYTGVIRGPSSQHHPKRGDSFKGRLFGEVAARAGQRFNLTVTEGVTSQGQRRPCWLSFTCVTKGWCVIAAAPPPGAALSLPTSQVE